ncbi:MAG: hypothetical protein ACXWE0_10060, partial [Nitrososphaeraceae archaeon]
PILSFELCLSVILFLKSMKNDEAHPGLMKFIAGFIIGISYLTTEVGALMIPIIFLYQFCKKQVSKRDSFLLFGFLSVVISELLYYYVFYESAFYKFNVHSQDLAQDPMLHSANINLIKRLLMAYPRFFLLPNADFSLFGPIMIIGGIYGIFNFRKSGFLIIWSMAILVFYNFMSVRLDKYVALPVATRLLFPGCIPLLILSSKSIIEITKYLEKSVINPMLIHTTYILKYLIICLFIIFSLMMDSINNNTSLTSIIARNSENVAQFLSDKKSVNLISDLRTSNSISFYRQYRNEDGIFDYERGRQEPENKNINNRVTTYLVINGVILNEKEITGSYYGETLSVPKNALGILKSYQVEYKKPVYESQYKKSIFYDYIINNKIISCILGKDKYNRIANIFKYKTSLTKIMVYRYQ